MVNITTKLAKSTNYTKGRNVPIQYIVIHFTANNADTDTGNSNYFANNILQASAHYFVDEDSITQSVLDTDTAWHCGTKGMYYHAYCRNTNSIGIEMCSDIVDGVYVITEDTIKNTVDLVKNKMVEYSIPLDNVVTHNMITGKACPEPFVREPQQWEDFKTRLIGDEEEVEIKDVKFVNKENGYEFTVKGVMVGDTNYVSARQLMETFGFKIDWNNDTETIIVDK